MTKAHIHLITPNPTVDVHYLVPAWQRGEANRVQTVTRQVGGKGINSARLLRLWNNNISTGGFFGASTAPTHSAAIGELNPDFVPIAGQTRQAVIVADGDGDTVFNEPGPTVTDTDWRELQTRALAHTHSTEAIVSVHGSLPPGSQPEAVARLVAAVAARGARTVVDTHGPGLIAAAKAGADFLLPNEHEAAEVAGTARGGGEALLELGAKNVIVTLAARGMVWLAPGGHVVRAHLPTPIAGHATGAGDAVTAALLAILASGQECHGGHLPTLVACGAGAVASSLVGAVDEQVASLAKRQVQITAQAVW